MQSRHAVSASVPIPKFASLAAPSSANFGIKGTLATSTLSSAAYGFEVPTRDCRELIGTSNPPHWTSCLVWTNNGKPDIGERASARPGKTEAGEHEAISLGDRRIGSARGAHAGYGAGQARRQRVGRQLARYGGQHH